MAGMDLPNGVTSSYEYDELGRLNVMTDTDSAGNILAEYDYEVRADGKRTAASETFWFDANEDGAVDAGEYQTRTYDWTYDNANRLTDEVFTDVGDMMNDVDNYHTNFTYDTTGNRLNRTTITDDDGSPGFDANTDSAEATSYLYDANDRLVEELLDSTDNAKDRTTTYSYDQTQQTQKAVTDSENRKLNTVHFAYNLQGRMSSVINDGFDASGTLNARERTSYTYDSKSFRTSLLTETGTSFSPDLNTENWQLKTETQFLADHRNHTGYTQTIRETKTNADGSSVTTDYTFGHDEISQRVVERDAAGNITSDTTHLFGHDGHGSVRMLTDLSGVIAQVFTFAAYGSMVAVHSGNGTLAGTTEAAALTSLGYSGEHFDGKAQQQYLRARFYNPANGRFNRLDPFAGNSTDPQSFHKYLYTHGDPINGIDPTGLTSLSAQITVSGAQGNLRGQNQAAVYTAKQAAWAGVETTLEILLGKLIQTATGIKFDVTPGLLARSYFTNFAVNLATSHLGHSYKLRNLLDFGLRTLSDVAIGGEKLWFSVAINLGSLAGSALLAHYGKKILGRAIGKWGGCFVPGTQVVVHLNDEAEEVDGFANEQGVTTQLVTTTRAIESVALGSRVVTEATEQNEGFDEYGDPEQTTWAKIDLVQYRSDGTRIEMELLRPKRWIAAMRLHVGKTIPLEFPELQTFGVAEVTAIEECPLIETGAGDVVIGRFISRDVTNLLRFYLEDGSTFTGTTTHPTWCVDELRWKRLDEFKRGDSVKTLDGTLHIDDIKDGQPSSDVFNIEVNREHVYRLLQSGVLVHNANYPDIDVGHILTPLAKNGTVSGGHSIHSFIGGLASRVKAFASNNPHGAYKALIEVADGQGGFVRAVKTMFPDNWSPSKILDEIEAAAATAVPHPTKPNALLGTGPSGLEITMFRQNGLVVTAYPHL